MGKVADSKMDPQDLWAGLRRAWLTRTFLLNLDSLKEVTTLSLSPTFMWLNSFLIPQSSVRHRQMLRTQEPKDPQPENRRLEASRHFRC